MSDYGSQPPAQGCIIVGLIALGLVLWALSSALRPSDPNPELVRMVREAAERAEEARKDADSTRRSANAIRTVALILALTVPLVVAYLIYRLAARSEARPEEIADALEDARLHGARVEDPQEIAAPTRRLISPPGGQQRGEKKWK